MQTRIRSRGYDLRYVPSNSQALLAPPFLARKGGNLFLIILPNNYYNLSNKLIKTYMQPAEMMTFIYLIWREEKENVYLNFTPTTNTKKQK